MSQEKHTPAQAGTGQKQLFIQKLHKTGEGNVKFKLNRFTAKRLFQGKKDAIQLIQQRMAQKGVFK